MRRVARAKHPRHCCDTPIIVRAFVQIAGIAGASPAFNSGPMPLNGIRRPPRWPPPKGVRPLGPRGPDREHSISTVCRFDVVQEHLHAYHVADEVMGNQQETPALRRIRRETAPREERTILDIEAGIDRGRSRLKRFEGLGNSCISL